MIRCLKKVIPAIALGVALSFSGVSILGTIAQAQTPAQAPAKPAKKAAKKAKMSEKKQDMQKKRMAKKTGKKAKTQP
ncbi:MAG: hypothetical protein ACKVSF_02625 [Alphaproteobacteria bacterium]